MKNLFSTSILTLATACTLSAQTPSFTDWNGSGFMDGDVTGSANWAGFGTVNVNFTFNNGATGLPGAGATGMFPRVGTSQGTLEPYGPALTSGGALTWVTGLGSPAGASATGTFTFSGGAFPTDSVFYITDNDVEPVLFEAFLGGVPVDVSNWFNGSLQTDPPSGAFGGPAGWDPLTSTTIPFGSNSEFFVQEFIPTSAFDTVRITNQRVGTGRIGFTIGNVILVPEPTSALLAAFLGGLTLLRRRR